MADTKISQLPAVVAVSGTDEFAVNQAFASKKVSTSQLQSFISTGSFTGSFAGQIPANNVLPGVFSAGAYLFPSGYTQSSPDAGFHNAGFTEWHDLTVAPATPDS